MSSKFSTEHSENAAKCDSRLKSRTISADEIKAKALSLGFSACGIAKAAPVSEDAAAHFMQWLQTGMQAGMAYMNNYVDKRLDPRLLMPGTKSIISVALNYCPGKRIAPGEYQFAAYAYGRDYHDIVREKLNRLAASCGFEHYRAFCDTAPVLERFWAVEAGIGWIGRHHQLIIPDAGSMFFLGEIFVDEEFCYDQPIENRCGDCRRCLDACPLQAIKEGAELDAGRCLSYHTIENRGEIPSSVVVAMGDVIYGCDRCLQACPWNRFAVPTEEPGLQPSDEFMGMTRDKWAALTEDDFRRIFKGSAVKRAKYSGLMRNINIAKNQS